MSSVRTDPPETYCGKKGPNSLTCCLRPHEEGDHGCWHPEGDPKAVWIPWPQSEVNVPKKRHLSPYDAVAKARNMGFTGQICGECGSPNTKQNGSCLVCSNCGRTTGCS